MRSSHLKVGVIAEGTESLRGEHKREDAMHRGGTRERRQKMVTSPRRGVVRGLRGLTGEGAFKEEAA